MSGKIIDVSDSLNYNVDRYAEFPIMKVYKDELYCAWREQNKSISQVKIKKYNGITWSDISNNLNYDGDNHSYKIDMEVYRDDLYCAWAELDNPSPQMKIKKYDGINWNDISNSLNYDREKSAYNPNLQVYKDELYCVWEEKNSDTFSWQIKIKKYNGNGWISVSKCLNYDAKKDALMPNLQVYRNELYCIWNERNESNYQIKMKKYNGNTWTNISSNLNYSGRYKAYWQTMKVYKNELYCAWVEYNESSKNDFQIIIKKYNGTSWNKVFSNLNYDVNNEVQKPTLQVYRDELYCTWIEVDDSNSQIKMKKYNGTSWINVADSINYNEDKSAYEPNLEVYKDELYCVWHEKRFDGSNTQIKMKKYTLLAEKIQKYLIKHNDKYYKLNDNGEIIEVENSNFKTNGFNNINIINRELLENKFHDLKNIQILMWTNDIEKNEATMTCELRNPYRPIDVLKKNNSGICNILFKEL